MGLDTVELLVTMEKHFSIAIPDHEAAEISTVQNFVDCVYAKITLCANAIGQEDAVYHRLTESLQNKLSIEPNVIYYDAKIKDVLGDRDVKSCWQILEAGLELKLPSLTSLDLALDGPPHRKILGFKIYYLPKPITEGSLRKLTTWIMALNHRQLLDPKALCTKTEVECIVIGIVSESCGIPVTEIEMHHSITDDYGMD